MFVDVGNNKTVNLEQVSLVELVSLSVGGNSKFRWVFHAVSDVVVMSKSFDSVDKAEEWFSVNVQPKLDRYNEIRENLIKISKHLENISLKRG
ncbi:MAG: hypothetical protein GXO22_07380 [Aquificae bacterium]|nr:hypothetical protein [Aquificota bacterium]